MVHAFILTGFLGVGKTTILTKTVKSAFKDKKVAIIVNEFGDVGVDGTILTNVHSEVLEISEGCICCKLSQEFEAGVIEIMDKYNPDIVFVETSGASEPFPIFLSLQSLGISIEAVICVCDAKNFNAYKDNSTAKYQIGGSNVIVISKTDLVESVMVERLKDEISKIKEKFNLKNNLTGEPIFSNYLITTAKNGIVPIEVFQGVYAPEEIASLPSRQKHHSHHSINSFSQQALYVNKSATFSDIERLLKSLPKNIFRVKGVVKLKDIEKPIYVNFVFGDVSYEELKSYDKDSVLIFIGEEIQEGLKSIQKRFDFLHLPKFIVGKNDLLRVQ